MNKANAHAVLLLVITLAALLVGCHRSDPKEKPPRDKATDRELPVNEREPWVSKPVHEWPQLLLTNDAEFNGHTPLKGASAFLIRTPKGRTLAATAKHLLGANGGVEPEIALPRLDAAIKAWRMHPRTAPETVVNAEGLGAKALQAQDSDWLILTLKKTPDPLPAGPLLLRSKPVQGGDKVFLIGCPYAESACKQNVYVGKVTARSGSLFRYTIEPPANIRGFSGAPVIDENGHVAGVMTVWFEPKMQGEKYLEAGGDDASSVYQLIE